MKAMEILLALTTRLIGLTTGGDATFWLPRQSSTIAADVDWAWSVVYWVSAFFFSLVVVSSRPASPAFSSSGRASFSSSNRTKNRMMMEPKPNPSGA